MKRIGQSKNIMFGPLHERAEYKVIVYSYTKLTLLTVLLAQEMAPQSMELSTPFMIMRRKKSSEVVIYMEVDEPCMVH